MRTEKNKILKFGILAFCLLFIFQGCGMMEANRRKKEELQERMEKQKESYLALRQDLQSKKVKAGALQEEVKIKYGEPADVFDSVSEVSNFALWSYEYPDTDRHSSAYRALRLYFNNGKLTYWTN